MESDRDTSAPPVDLELIKARRPRCTPSRASSTDSAMSREEHSLLRRKLRGLRSKSRRTLADESKNCSDRSLQGRDDPDKMGSSRSMMTQESSASALSGVTVESSAAGSFAGCRIADAYPTNVVADSCVVDALKPSNDPTPSSSNDCVSTAPTNGRPWAFRGMPRNERMNVCPPEVNLMVMSSNHSSILDSSEHSNTSLSAASLTARERLAQRSRTRGLGGKTLSVARKVEPVSPIGIVSPLHVTSLSQCVDTSDRSLSVDALSPILPTTTSGRGNRSSMPMVMLQPRCAGLLEDAADQDQESLHRPCPSVGSTYSATSISCINNNSTRGIEPSGSLTGSLTSRPGLRGRREFSDHSQRTSANHLSGSQHQTGRSARTQVQHAQAQAEALYQPTQHDWAVLYNKHVEELERKDLEIAMKISTLPGGLSGSSIDDGEDDDDVTSVEGLELALEVSRTEVQNTFCDEDEMLQMVLEMSRHEELETSFAGCSFSSLPMAGFPVSTPSTRCGGNQGRGLSEEEELERVLALSQHEGQKPKLQAAATNYEEDEELQRILRLSELQHKEQEQMSHLKSEVEEDEEGDDLQRVLQMSQREALDLDRERETLELVLQLSRQGTVDGALW